MDEATSGSVGQASENAEIEAAIEACVRNFYAKGRNDDLLGPVFNSSGCRLGAPPQAHSGFLVTNLAWHGALLGPSLSGPYAFAGRA